MPTTTLTPSRPIQMIVTLEDKTTVADIKKALRLIRGIASVRIKKARKEYANGETISCNTPEEMQKYFDSL